MSVSNTRFASIDAMRGFAILLVVMGHVAYHSLHMGDSLLFQTIAMVNMPLFVILSGYLATNPLSLSLRGATIFWQGKTTRLLLPLIVLPSLYQYIQDGSMIIPFTAIFEQPWNEYWFTYTLFCIFLVFYGVRLFIDLTKLRKWWFAETVVMLLSIIAIEGVSRLYPEAVWSSYIQLGKVAWLYKYFVLGYFIGKYPTIQSFLKTNVVGLMSALLFLLGVMLYSHLDMPFPYGSSKPIFLLIAMSFFVVTYYTANRLTDDSEKLSRVIIGLGRYSLPIYLTHYFFLLPLSFLHPYLDNISSNIQILGIEVLMYLFGAVLTLMPTFIVVRWVMANPLLAFVCYGEPLPKRKV